MAAIAVPGAANAAAPSTSATVAHEVQGLLAHNRGSVQISADTVQLADGPTIAVLPNSASGSCHGGYLCFFWNTNFGSYQLTMGPYNGCAYYNLSSYYAANGKSWSDQASSIDNPSPRPGPAYFYHGGSSIYSLAGGHYLKDLTKDTASNGHTMNDYIETVWTC